VAGQTDIDRVRDATDLVQIVGEHVTLRPKGREHVGLCPFHEDRTPSLAVVTHKGNAFFKCHACGAGGDVFDFVRQYHKMEFGEALRYLADRAGITLSPPKNAQIGNTCSDGPSRANLREANSIAALFFRHTLKSSAGAQGRLILQGRGISDDVCEAFMLGLAPDAWDGLQSAIRRRRLAEADFAAAGLLKPRREGFGYYDAFRNRLIFPICNDLGQPIAFGARKVDPEDEPKYLNSAESALFHKSRALYGIHLAKRAIIDSRQAIVTEGYTDVIACHQHGVTNVVATLGTALTRDHARALSRLCDVVVLVFDGDEAGQRAADRAVEVFFAETVDIRIAVLPDGLDPDELLRQDGGRERFMQAVASAEDALLFKLRRFMAVLDAAPGLSARQKALEQLLGDLADLGFSSIQGVRKRMVLTHLADLLKLSVSDLERAMPQRRASAPAPPLSPANGTALPELAAGPNVSRARRQAEHELLALLVFEPSLGMQQISDGNRTGRISELMAEHFLDPAAAAIARAAFSLIDRSGSFAVQQLLSELEHDEHRRVVSSLYFEGQRLCAGDSPVECAARAVRGLVEHMAREEHEQALAEFQRRRADAPNGNTFDAVHKIIRQRQQTPTMAAAICRGVRT
jgi:DNA primase